MVTITIYHYGRYVATLRTSSMNVAADVALYYPRSEGYTYNARAMRNA